MKISVSAHKDYTDYEKENTLDENHSYNCVDGSAEKSGAKPGGNL